MLFIIIFGTLSFPILEPTLLGRIARTPCVDAAYCYRRDT